jgi:hypothetical protein
MTRAAQDARIKSGHDGVFRVVIAGLDPAIWMEVQG